VQRALCEDPKLIQAWFDQYCAIIAEYGIDDDDIYNFDETGFAMGITSTSKVVTSREWHGKRKLLQPGNREWVTAIECIHLNGVLPPTIIFKAKNLMTAWYSTVPRDWRFEVSDNGWTTDQIGILWLENSFIPCVIQCRCGTWILLVIDGHRSYLSPQFDTVCKEHNIIPICILAYSSHLLQPLDMGCFGVLKHFYSQRVQDLVCIGTTYIDKLDFLDLYPAARNATYQDKIIASSFMGSGLIPYSPGKVLQELDIRAATPTPPPSRGSASSHEFVPHTPCKSVHFRRQMSSIKQLIAHRSFTPDGDVYQQLEQITKGAQNMANQLTILTATCERVMAENRHKQRKQAKRNRQLAYEGELQPRTCNCVYKLRPKQLWRHHRHLRGHQDRPIRALRSDVVIAERQGISALRAHVLIMHNFCNLIGSG
jgi:DDE superfamily endonuclease.